MFIRTRDSIMQSFKFVYLSACVLFASTTISTQSNAQSLQALDENLTMDDVVATLNGKTLMDLMEEQAAQDPNYDGPPHLYPANKAIIRKRFLPDHFDRIDRASNIVTTRSEFIVGDGDQTQTVRSRNSFYGLRLYPPGTNLDAPVNKEIWGSLTEREVYETLDFPTFKRAEIHITFPSNYKTRLPKDISVTNNHLSVEARDGLGAWVYTLEMPINTEIPSVTFTAKDLAETYTLDGITTDEILSIWINREEVYRKEVTEKPSDKLRDELGL